MRIASLALPLACLAAAPLLAQTAAPPAPPPAAGSQPPAEGRPHVGGHVFISPMGEPFRGDEPSESLAAQWFLRADADHDGRLTSKEMQADAARFYATLDLDHDGEIAPDEIDNYENKVAPEIRMGLGAAMMMRTQMKYDGGGWSEEADENSANLQMQREGAGRFGWIDVREPVTTADTNLDRGVSPEEFTASAIKRFALLDTQHRGYLTLDTMPALPKVTMKRKGGKGPGRGGRGSGHGGGMGGGMGGMGGGGAGGPGGGF